MDLSVHSPSVGNAGTLTPALVKSRYFEFFPAGTHREVLLLSDLVEQCVHRVKSKGYNVLCGARAGRCDLCERAAESDDIGIQRSEYYAAGFVRIWREKTFEQKVPVFSAAAAEQILRLIPEGSARGQRLEVVRYAHGSSSRFKITLMQGLPAGFPTVLPAAYDVVPFIRARYGKPAHPTQVMTILAPFKCERSNMAAVGRPKPLGLSAEDCAPIAEDQVKVREILEANRHKWADNATAAAPPTESLIPPPTVTPPATPAVAAEPPPPAPAPKVILVPVAVPISDPAAQARADAMRRQAEEARQRRATGSNRLTSIEAGINEVEAGVLGRTNGKHPTKKGGAN